MKRLLHTLWRPVRIGLVVYLLVLLVLMIFEESLIFFPMKHPDGVWNPMPPGADDAEFTAEDGTKLHGWYARQENPRAVILFCHGNAGNITHRAGVLRILHGDLHCSVLLFDYRGYGRSEGTPNEAGVLADGRAARDWLAKREDIDPADVVLMGRSLGAAVAIDLAAADGARALVLESAFTSIPDVAAFHYPWAPVRWLMRTRLNNTEKIARYDGPLLQTHGDADEIIPYPLGKRLHAASPSENKKLLTISGALHNDNQPPGYYEELRAFLDGL